MSRATHILDVIIVALAPPGIFACGLSLVGAVAAGRLGAAVICSLFILLDTTIGLISARSLRAEWRARR